MENQIRLLEKQLKKEKELKRFQQIEKFEIYSQLQNIEKTFGNLQKNLNKCKARLNPRRSNRLKNKK